MRVGGKSSATAATDPHRSVIQLLQHRIKLSPLLRVRDGHRNIRFSRSLGDRAILIDTKIGVPQRAADLICGAAAAEDRSSEIIFEDIARPVSREHTTLDNIPAIADPPGHSSGVIAGKNRIEPFQPLLGDSGIGKRKGCTPRVPRAANAAWIACVVNTMLA